MIIKIKLSESIQGFWAVPLSGYGHTADEQPMPYLENEGIALTPRFGGEENKTESNNESLPLPKGKLKTKWPLAQRIFNLFRRRINIYWRNVFKTHTRIDKQFLFIEQLNYQEIKNGFKGECPLVTFVRTFEIEETVLIVKDIITFKKNVEFTEFEYAMTPILRCNAKKTTHIDSDVDVEQNHVYPIQSSTGLAEMKSKKLENTIFKKGQLLEVRFRYKVSQ